MITSRHVLFLSLLVLCAGACADDEGEPPVGNDASAAAPDGSGTASDGGSSDDAGVEVRTGAPAGPGPATGLAVLSSDLTMVTSLSLIPLGGTTLARDACLHSGTQSPALSAALSGDVTLPSQPQSAGELLVIDRGANVLTWIDPAVCTVRRQMNVGMGFAANPSDVVDLGAGKAYVLRYLARPSSDEGSDILIIDPAGTRALGRIDLRPHTPTATGATILPMPARAVWAGGKVYVALNALSADYKAAAQGRVVVVDPAADSVAGTIDLPGLKNCGGIESLPEANALVVSCGGPFSDGDKRIDSSGLAWIDLAATPPQVSVVRAAMVGRPISGFSVAPLSETRAFVLTEGDFAGPAKDTLWAVDMKAGAATKIHEGSGGFVMSYQLDRVRKLLYVGDASDKDPKIIVFGDVEAAVPAKRGELKSNPMAGLPPRAFGFY